jgi:hypothetical protein
VLPFRADMNEQVADLELAGDTLYVGGQFTAPRTGLAAVDAESGALRTFDAGLDGDVLAVADAASAIVAGGDFTKVNGTVPRPRLAAFERAGGGVTPFSADVAGIRDMDVLDGVLYAGGTFQTIGPAARTGLAALDSTTGAASAWNPQLTNYPAAGPAHVLSVAATPEGGVLAGGFFWIDGPGTPVAHLAAFPVPPRPPGGVGATAGDGRATVSFSAPATGGAPIASYTVTASPGGATATGSGSPITVGGLTNGTPHTFTVTATNRAGTSGPSAPAGLVTPGTLAGGPGGAAPQITEFSATRKLLRSAKKRMAATGPATAAAKRPKRGTTLRLGLTAAATVRFDVLVEAKGRRARGKCRKPTRANRRGKKCVRLVRRAVFRRTAPAGRSRVAFTARLAKKPLKPGRYRIRATPVDTAGRAGSPRSVKLRIVR